MCGFKNKKGTNTTNQMYNKIYPSDNIVNSINFDLAFKCALLQGCAWHIWPFKE